MIQGHSYVVPLLGKDGDFSGNRGLWLLFCCWLQPQHPPIWPVRALTAPLPGEQDPSTPQSGDCYWVSCRPLGGATSSLSLGWCKHSTMGTTQFPSPSLGWNELSVLCMNNLPSSEQTEALPAVVQGSTALGLGQVRPAPIPSVVAFACPFLHLTLLHSTGDACVPWIEKNQGGVAQSRVYKE